MTQLGPTLPSISGSSPKLRRGASELPIQPGQLPIPDAFGVEEGGFVSLIDQDKLLVPGRVVQMRGRLWRIDLVLENEFAATVNADPKRERVPFENGSTLVV
jgi:hypothetical protein